MSFPEIIQQAWPLILLALLIGGLTKGMMGIGLPAIAIPIMLLQVDLLTALAVMMVPSFLSNFIQVVQRPGTAKLIGRFTPMILCMLPATVAGVWLLAVLPVRVAVGALGVLTVLYVITELTRFKLRLQGGRERAWSIGAGLCAGLIGGFTGIYGPPVAMYLLALNMDHEDFVSAISLVFLAAVVMFYPILYLQGLLQPQLILTSALAMIPVYAAMEAGRWLRMRLSPEGARRILFVFLGLLGLDLVRRGFAIPMPWAGA